MHIIPQDSVLTTQMHFSPTHLVPLLLSTLFGGLASKLSLKGSTIELCIPTNWMDISQLTNVEQWPLLYSLSMERMEKERLKIPVEAFRFWEQRDFKELLMEVMDKSAFFKFSPEEEKMQGIG